MKYTWGIRCTTVSCSYKNPNEYEFGGKCDTCGALYCNRFCKADDASYHANLCAPTWEERMQLHLKHNVCVKKLRPYYVFELGKKRYVEKCTLCGRKMPQYGKMLSGKDVIRCSECVHSYRCPITFLKITTEEDKCNRRNRSNFDMILRHFGIKLGRKFYWFVLERFIWCHHHIEDSLEYE